jgi:hypothetical protein
MTGKRFSVTPEAILLNDARPGDRQHWKAMNLDVVGFLYFRVSDPTGRSHEGGVPKKIKKHHSRQKRWRLSTDHRAYQLIF